MATCYKPSMISSTSTISISSNKPRFNLLSQRQLHPSLGLHILHNAGRSKLHHHPSSSPGALFLSARPSTASLSTATTAVSEVTLGLLGSNISPLFDLEWWAFIVLATVLLRFVTLPLEIYGTKLECEIAPITQKLEDTRLSRNEFCSVFKENRVTIVNTLVLMIINDIIYISVVLAIMFMVKKAPSFKQGGAYWFPDLTKPDPSHIFPFLSTLISFIRSEINKKPARFGTRVISIEGRRFCWMVMAYLKFSVLKWFPSALFCYWISSEVFELLYVIAIKHPKVKKFLKLP